MIRRLPASLKLVLCFLFVVPAIVFGQKRQISYPKDLPVEVAADLQYLLSKSTGQAWELAPDQQISKGLVLCIVQGASYKTGESSILTSNGKDLIQIQAPTINGLIFGVYRHLRDAGFKFYLPDEIYTIIPSQTLLFARATKKITPYVRIRDFFGTGGFGTGNTDPDKSVQKSWQLWKWRNGFGTEFPLAGHVGETFNLSTADVLAKNPTWTATPIMQNGKVDVTTKLNYLDPKAVDFFTDWVIKKYTDKNYKPPPVYIRDMVSIEPADGGSFMQGTTIMNGVRINTVSDQVYNAANIAAAKLDKLFPNHPNIGVNMYAYSGHAETPSFPLNPRVFVQIIPYQFQNIAFGPAFVKRWAEKTKRFGLYDYFKYTDSHWDMPSGFPLDEVMNRAMHAVKSGSEGTVYESSNSKFSTAIPLWVISRYLADGQENWEANYNQLTKELYGHAATEIGKMFKIFYRQSQFSSSQLESSYEYLATARKSGNDKLVNQRLDELELYLTYVSLYQESNNLKAGTMEERLLPISKLAWTLYETKLIHSYRIMALISYAFLNTPGPDAATTKRYKELHLLTFPETTEPTALWKQPAKSSQYSSKELASMSQSRKNKNLNQSKSIHEETGMAEVIAEAKKNYSPASSVSIQGNNTVRGYFSLYAEKSTRIEISWEITEGTSFTISGTNNDFTNVYDKSISAKTGTYAITIPKGETSFFMNAAAATTYRIKVSTNGTWLHFGSSPRGKMAFLDKEKKLSYKPEFYPTYFHVPKGATEVKYRVQLNALKIYDPAGNLVPTTLLESEHGGFEIRTFKVDPKYQGRMWNGVLGGIYNYALLTIPDTWFMLSF